VLTRIILALSLAVFLGIVSTSFAYGLYLLWRGPVVALAAPKAAPSTPPSAAVPGSLSAARRHLKAGEIEQAIVAYRHILTASPAFEAQLGLAEGERLAGRDEVAAKEYERALQLDPHSSQALRPVARIYARRAETWPRAETLYRQLVEQEPGDTDAHLELARLLVWQAKPAAAIGYYARPDVQARMSVADRRDYAFALVKAGRRAEAERVLESLIASHAADDAVTLQLAGLRASRRDWTHALPLYESVLARRPTDASLLLAYGLGQLSLGNYGAALAPLGRAARARREDRAAALAYARALRGSGDLAGASAQFEKALRLPPDDAGVRREYADVLLQRHKYGPAAEQYRRVLWRGPRDRQVLLALGGALSADGKPREALPYLEEAYSRHADGRLAYDLAVLYQRVGRNDRALELLRAAEGPR
jgi:tetratricopeptide (TPR) repeat protein